MKVHGQEETFLNWEEDHTDTTFVIDGEYRAETYYEIDSSYSTTVKKGEEEVFYQEDIVCLYQAQLFAEMFIRRDNWQSRAEAAEQKLERLKGIASDMVEYAGSGRRIGQHILKILDEDNQGGE